MKYAWLTLVLQLTNRIYQRKQNVVGQEGLAAVGNVFSLVLLEIVLAVVSLPLYLNLRPQRIEAFFKEKGAYAEITFDYNLRRVLTLTGVGIVLFIWVLKLLLILVVPSLFGTLRLYSVSDLRAPDLLMMTSEQIVAETGIQSARVDAGLTPPELQTVRKSGGKDFVFYGTAEPNSSVVLLLSDQQTAMYTTTADERGNWTVEHDQSNFALGEGNHSVLTFTFDEGAKTRSEFSNEQYFKVTTSILDVVTRNVDSLANWSVVILLFCGVFLTFLTI